MGTYIAVFAGAALLVWLLSRLPPLRPGRSSGGEPHPRDVGVLGGMLGGRPRDVFLAQYALRRARQEKAERDGSAPPGESH